MKVLSLLLVVLLPFTADLLAAALKHAGVLPADHAAHTTTAPLTHR